MPTINRELWLIGISFFMVYIIWGSTYLANAWGVLSVPPFIYSGTRFILAGILLFVLTRSRNKTPITRLQVKNTIIAGLLLFAIGNGLVTWSLKYVDSGIASLIVAFQPLIVVFLMWVMRNQRPTIYSWIGVSIGIFGMYFLSEQPQFVSDPEWLMGVSGIIVALMTWGFCLIWMKEADLPDSILQSAALQMIFGGCIMYLISIGLGEWIGFELAQIQPVAMWSMVYLVIFGSVMTFSAFTFLVKKVSADKVSTSAFVNPVIALFLGAWLNSEVVTNQSVLAAVMLLTGVLFINGQVKLVVDWVRRSPKDVRVP